MRYSSGISARLAPVILVLLGLVLSYFLYMYLGIGVDWHQFYWRIPRAWLAGETHLYDAASEAFYNPPWLIPMILPLALLPEVPGLVVFRLVDLAIIAYAASYYTPQSNRKSLSTILIMFSLLVWDAIIVGNVDFIVLLGLVLLDKALTKRQPWLMGFALVLATIKPQLSVIPLLLLLPGMLHWPWEKIWHSFVIPLIAFILSFFIAGPDWLLRLFNAIAYNSPATKYDPYFLLEDVSLYRLWNVLGLPIWSVYPIMALVLAGLLWHSRHIENIKDRLAIGLAAGPLIIPYTSVSGLALAVIVAWPRLIERGRDLAAAIVFSMQFLFLLRGVPDFTLLGTRLQGISWVMVFFVITLTIALLFSARSGKQRSSGQTSDVSVDLIQTVQ